MCDMLLRHEKCRLQWVYAVAYSYLVCTLGDVLWVKLPFWQYSAVACKMVHQLCTHHTILNIFNLFRCVRLSVRMFGTLETGIWLADASTWPCSVVPIIMSPGRKRTLVNSLERQQQKLPACAQPEQLPFTNTKLLTGYRPPIVEVCRQCYLHTPR